MTAFHAEHIEADAGQKSNAAPAGFVMPGDARLTVQFSGANGISKSPKQSSTKISSNGRGTVKKSAA
jgi:hypothetical protein